MNPTVTLEVQDSYLTSTKLPFMSSGESSRTINRGNTRFGYFPNDLNILRESVTSLRDLSLALSGMVLLIGLIIEPGM